jgi:hypothetical protein
MVRLIKRLMEDRLPLPKRKVGSVRIDHTHHPAGSQLWVVGLREAIFTGRRPLRVTFSNDLVTHRLISKRHGTWMSDQPNEMVQTWQQLAVHASGDVLIGGLGLGVLPHMLSRRKAVRSITIVEQSAEVIRLIEPLLRQEPVDISIIRDDIHRFAAKLPRSFDCALLDTWQATGEWTWQSEVVPLRRTLQPQIRNIRCWAEGVMVGDVGQVLPRVVEMDADNFRRRSHCHYYAFRRAAVAEGIRPKEQTIDAGTRDLERVVKLEQKNREDRRLMLFMRQFLWGVGRPRWERTFGKYWDEAWGIDR